MGFLLLSPFQYIPPVPAHPPYSELLLCHLPWPTLHLVAYCFSCVFPGHRGLGIAPALCGPTPGPLFLQCPLLGMPFLPMATGLILSFNTQPQSHPPKKPSCLLLVVIASLLNVHSI